MVSREQIQAYADKIAERFDPEKIILFGSYAYGQPNEDSDVDLLVVMEHSLRNWQKATEISQEVGYSGFAMDLLVRPEDHVKLRLSEEDPFFGDIITKGVVLYERKYSALA
jgi:predicted nucleotidyltransferase